MPKHRGAVGDATSLEHHECALHMGRVSFYSIKWKGAVMQKRERVVYRWWQSLQGPPTAGPVPGGILDVKCGAPREWPGWVESVAEATELDNTKERTVI